MVKNVYCSRFGLPLDPSGIHSRYADNLVTHARESSRSVQKILRKARLNPICPIF